MSLVFLSYSHQDSSIADDICEVLTESGIEHFRDIKDIPWGGSIPSEVRDALERSVAVLVILSEHSLDSNWVPYEMGFAAALRKRLLPFVTQPSLQLPLYISDLSYVKDVAQVREFFVAGGLMDAVAFPVPGAPPTLEAVFRKLASLMPDLLAEMKADLSKEPVVREFILPYNRNVIFGHTKKRFSYFQSEHEDLENKVDLLEQHGLVTDVTIGNAAIYRMSEELVGWLEVATFG